MKDRPDLLKPCQALFGEAVTSVHTTGEDEHVNVSVYDDGIQGDIGCALIVGFGRHYVEFEGPEGFTVSHSNAAVNVTPIKATSASV